MQMGKMVGKAAGPVSRDLGDCAREIAMSVIIGPAMGVEHPRPYGRILVGASLRIGLFVMTRD